MCRLSIEIDGKWGFIDGKGTIVIPPEYDGPARFSEGVAAVWRREEQTTYVINTEGGLQGSIANIISFADFSEGLLQFYIDHDDMLGKGGYIDRRASVVIPARFDSAFDFQDGLACVQLDRKWGVIDRLGDWVIPPQFDELLPFNAGEDVTAFKTFEYDELKGDWGLINRSGRIVVQPTYRDLKWTYRGLTPARPHDVLLFGFIDQSGDWVVEPQFENCGMFSEDSIAVERDDKWGVVDLNGTWIIPPKYTSANAFHEGLSLVYLGGERDLNYCLHSGKFGFINGGDELVIPASYDRAYHFANGFANVELFVPGTDPEDEIMLDGWIDRTGKYVWEPSR